MATKKQKFKKRPIPKVAAVGFASYNPQVLVVFTAYSPDPNDRIYMYKEGEELEFASDDGQKNYVILTAPERILDLRPYADRIHRLLVFGTPDQLSKLGLPILDVEIDDNGKISRVAERELNDLRNDIDQKAIIVKLKKAGVKAKPKKQEPEKSKKKIKAKQVAEDSSDQEAENLIDRLRRIQSTFSGDKVDFENVVLFPTFLRLCKQIKKSEFLETCDEMLDFEVDEDEVTSLKDFVLHHQKTLGKAARKILWPKDPDKGYSIKKAAAKYNVNPKDVKLIVLGVKQLQETTE